MLPTMKKVSLVPILIGLIFFSCQNDVAKEKGVDDLFQEVMKVHDDVMPKTADMSRLSRKIKRLKEESTDTSDLAAYDDVLNELEKADAAMMDWMTDFKVPTDDSAKMVYLIQEKVKITEVRDIMLSSLERASSFLNEITDNE